MQIKFLDPRLTEFKPASQFAAGYDLRACIEQEFHLAPGETLKIPTGIAVWQKTYLESLPVDLRVFNMNELNEEDIIVNRWVIPCALILPRSGLGCKGIKPRNAPGLIDADYQGEIIICLYNDSEEWFTIKPMDRIAQLIFMNAQHPDLEVVKEFDDKTERGAGGFGSTGSL